MKESMRKIRGDRWDGVLNHEWDIDRASVEDFDRALDRLDARIYTMLRALEWIT
jgi:hypothetical protein